MQKRTYLVLKYSKAFTAECHRLRGFEGYLESCCVLFRGSVAANYQHRDRLLKLHAVKAQSWLLKQLIWMAAARNLNNGGILKSCCLPRTPSL